eukprot:CAMPEP_0183327354 /NCGR_PEP_ID=MMETSP0160_2-20130417/83718_1 /TAXON_ID=2839 ORGANISM="Odontella Sinensis, Strain Grunow 1884" /NCGR_SAMPLE_ID=MMETSP0160_2 /ASSEMBLY_ACC=CAM_ASM_000250 /LENGTH=392 /DNA_ID=CAMNT_0025495479 /DNA_START=135 /DNA_END=1316 /DNA_ORIENTATION=+
MKTATIVAASIFSKNLILAGAKHIRGTKNGTQATNKDNTEWDSISDPTYFHDGFSEYAESPQVWSIDLDLEDLENTLISSEDFDIPGLQSSTEGKWSPDHRNTQSAKKIKVKNDCWEPITVDCLYVDGTAWRWVRIVVEPGKKEEIGQTNYNDYYLYAKSDSEEWDGTSGVCFNGGSCFAKKSFEEGHSSHTEHFSCENNNAPPTDNESPPSDTGSDGSLSQRDQDWLDSHNTRRQTFHDFYDAAYVPLKWSQELASSAKAYADKLIALSSCTIRHGYDDDSYGGENLAANWGGGGQRTTENILSRWVEGEVDDPYPVNGHFTQVIWRSTEYLGCGEASKDMGNGMSCHIQVCRYLRPGNCNADNRNWEEKMIKLNSPHPGLPLPPSWELQR